MAEIIGVVSGVLALVSAAQKAINAINDFGSATRERENMLRHLSNVESGLKKLEGILNKIDPNDQDLDDIRHHLEDFKSTINDLTERLEPSAGTSRFNIRERMKWTIKGKNQAQEDSTKIEEFEQLLGKWLSLDIWEKVRKHEENTRNEERQIILSWLSPINFFARQDEIFSKRQAETGTWLLENSDFKRWKSGEKRMLWCSGIPGAGKTVLAAVVMDHLRKEFIKDVGLAIVYCNYKEREIQTPVNLLSGILRQFYDGVPLSENIKALHRKHQDRSTRPTVSEVSELLISETQQFSKIFVIVDALDECPDENQYREFFFKHLQGFQPIANLMVTSRPDIPANPEFVRLDIVASKVDLDHYIDGRISTSTRLSSLLHGEEDRKRIKETVIENADGMFLLAQIHMTALATAISRKKLFELLRNLTTDLGAAYEKTLERIDNQELQDRALAWRVLGWVSHALRPLSTRELQEALAIEQDEANIEEDALVDANILASVCAGLIVLDGNTQVVRLVHYTAQHYLEEIRKNRFLDTQTDIARTCLSYISVTELPYVGYYWSSTMPSFFAYAVHYGMVHARGVPEVPLREMILNLLRQEARRRLIQKAAHPYEWELNYGLLSPMHLAIYLGLSEIAVGMVLDGECITSNGCCGPPIVVASWRGIEPIVRLLLERDADINAQGGEYGNALQAASSEGHVEIVRLLLNNGADVNAEGGFYRSALQAASSGGHESIVRLLLENGAEVNAQGGIYGGPLQAASSGGYEPIVWLLLENGADVNAQGGIHGSALQVASSEGHEKIVSLLLKKGAGVNIQGGRYENALQAASSGGHEQIVLLLLHSGAEVNVQGGLYGNALQAASSGGHEHIVLLLLENGADADAQGGLFGNALQAASSRGYEQIVRLLLENGANVDAQGGKYGNAILAASSKGHEQIVLLLLESGADVNVQGGRSGNALQAASIEGHERIVRLLLEKGADVNAQEVHYGNALQAASSEGHDQIVRLLLEKGADVNAQGGYYGTAFQAALRRGHEQLVRLLLEKGAQTDEEELFPMSY